MRLRSRKPLEGASANGTIECVKGTYEQISQVMRDLVRALPIPNETLRSMLRQLPMNLRFY